MLRSPVSLLCGAALFLGAALVFSLQPMLSKMVLPLLGGAPAVWNTIVVFFQGALFAGYLYAFVLDRYLPLPGQAGVHVLLLLAAVFLLLPVTVTAAWGVPDPALPQLWLLRNLTLFVALPFVVLAGTSTLLQGWFARSGTPGSTDPYFLYVASNAGSLIALVSYPVLVEPALTLAGQTRGWTLAYAGLALLTAVSASLIWLSRPAGGAHLTASIATGMTAEVGPTWARRLRWLGLAFVPSMMLLGVTLHLSTDVAAVPFLWVLPLLAYLLTFIFAFARRNPIPARRALQLQAVAVIGLAVFFRAGNFWVALPLNIAVLFFSGLVCHGALARERPGLRHLAEFYLWLAAGGFLGGLAAGVAAPVLFNGIYEYPIALGLACLARAGTLSELRARPATLWPGFAALVACGAVTLAKVAGYGEWFEPLLVMGAVGAGLAALLYLCRQQHVILAACVGLLAFGGEFHSVAGETLLQERTFFGVYRVRLEQGGHVRTFYHGTTLHGGQADVPGAEKLPLFYYYPKGPIGQLVRSRRDSAGLGPVGIIGLGAGAIPCLLEDAPSITYFEIDPAVARIASDPALFSFLQRCGSHTTIELGDGRLMLARKPAGLYDLLIVDAFSSDAIPVHLLTAEAMAMYVSKLRPGGVIAFHVSNKFMNIAPVLARLAANGQLAGVIQRYDPGPDDKQRGALDSDWVAIARTRADLEFLLADPRWENLDLAGSASLWTDEFSNLFGLLTRGTRPGSGR